MTMYERIDLLRKEQGIMWSHLNEKIGAYRGKLTEFKNGKTTLSQDEIFRIASVLGTSTDYLLGNTDDPSPPGAEEKPTPVSESGLSEDQKFLIDTVIDMTSDEARRFRLIVEEVILRRGQ